MNLVDHISSQQEINRLLNKVLRLKAEVSLWRSFAQTSTLKMALITMKSTNCKIASKNLEVKQGNGWPSTCKAVLQSAYQ